MGDGMALPMQHGGKPSLCQGDALLQPVRHGRQARGSFRPDQRFMCGTSVGIVWNNHFSAAKLQKEGNSKVWPQGFHIGFNLRRWAWHGACGKGHRAAFLLWFGGTAPNPAPPQRLAVSRGPLLTGFAFRPALPLPLNGRAEIGCWTVPFRPAVNQDPEVCERSSFDARGAAARQGVVGNASKGAFGFNSKGRPIPWGDIPARPFIGFSSEDELMIARMLDDWLQTATDQ
jgi:hypothetical protein